MRLSSFWKESRPTGLIRISLKSSLVFGKLRSQTPSSYSWTPSFHLLAGPHPVTPPPQCLGHYSNTLLSHSSQIMVLQMKRFIISIWWLVPSWIASVIAGLVWRGCCCSRCLPCAIRRSVHCLTRSRFYEGLAGRWPRFASSQEKVVWFIPSKLYQSRSSIFYVFIFK